MKKRRILGLMLALGMILGMMLGISTSVIAKDVTGTIEIDSRHFSALAKKEKKKKDTTITIIIRPYNKMTASAYINSHSKGSVSSAGESSQESSLFLKTQQDYIVENVVCKDNSPYNYVLYLSSLVTCISLSSSTLSLTAGGSTSTLTPTITPSEASYKSVKWSSDTPSVASVDSNGVVKPIKEGKATITATCDADNTKKASCTVTVEMSAEEKAAKEVAEKKAAADKAAASGVEEKIKVIGAVSYTDACKAKIDTARKAYDALTTDQKKLVTNYSTLTDAEKKYADMKAEADKIGIPVDAREFHCKGEFKGLHKGRPNEKDLKAAAEFAKKIVKGD